MLRALSSGHTGSLQGKAQTHNRAPLRCTALRTEAFSVKHATSDYARPDSASDANCGQASTSGACKTQQLSSRRLALLGLASTYVLSRSGSAFADEESNLPKGESIPAAAPLPLARRLSAPPWYSGLLASPHPTHPTSCWPYPHTQHMYVCPQSTGCWWSGCLGCRAGIPHPAAPC